MGAQQHGAGDDAPRAPRALALAELFHAIRPHPRRVHQERHVAQELKDNPFTLVPRHLVAVWLLVKRLDLVVNRGCDVALAFELALRVPLAPALPVEHAFEPGDRARVLAPVALVLPAGADAEIGSAVVGLVAVPVVHDHAVKDRVKPASRIGFKTSHFEEQTVCRRDSWKSVGFRFSGGSAWQTNSRWLWCMRY